MKNTCPFQAVSWVTAAGKRRSSYVVQDRGPRAEVRINILREERTAERYQDRTRYCSHRELQSVITTHPAAACRDP